MPNNMLIVHGGGPTAVINCSLYGAVDEAKKSGKVGKVYGALGGMRGVLTERFIQLDAVSDFDLALLKTTPGSAIGTSRDAMEAEDYAKVAQILKKRNMWICSPPFWNCAESRASRTAPAAVPLPVCWTDSPSKGNTWQSAQNTAQCGCFGISGISW